MCGCSVFIKSGQCAHVAYVRWLEGDGEIQLAALKDFTRGRGQRSAVEVESIARAPAIARAQPRGGRPLKLPTAAAWVTLDDIERKAAQRWAKRKEGESGGGRVHPDALVLLRSEKKKPRREEPSERRDVLLGRLGKDLRLGDFSRSISFYSSVGAGTSCRSDRVTSVE